MNYEDSISKLMGMGLHDEAAVIRDHVSKLEELVSTLNDAYNQEVELSGTAGKARKDRVERLDRMKRLEPAFRMYLWAYDQARQMTPAERNEKRKQLDKDRGKRTNPLYRVIKARKFTSERPPVAQIADFLADVDAEMGEVKSMNTYKADIDEWFSF